ncbi:thymidylate synthase [Candidatus Jorgensenbacteria bacterium GWC1_48_12]|uniref:Thymidylate synthase n=1 Tax=Candidatus Jorgensenbacteria bacterium GWC1_48_12 TaxID=1798469 RepID=A0A1F6BS23_9BACT|nr:MAG: thymidylate synthase [Candidatus Jorgensenbacteria bacterium GWC1_48_12]
MPIYKPYNERTPDYQYRNLLKIILKDGIYTKTPYQTKGTYTVATLPNMVFPVANGVPLITERKIGFWRKPISEIIAFINGARTLDELRKYGDEKTWAGWWATWVTPEKCAKFGLEAGDMGPGAYGPGYYPPTPDGGRFNQWFHLIKQIKERPSLRTHRVTPWIPYYCLQHDDLQRKVVVAPCHGDVQVTILDGKMFMRMDQRSGDVPIGVPSNMIQYAALLLMLAQVTGYEPHTFTHSIHDGQIYEDQVEKVKEIIAREPRPFPTLRITDPSIKDIFAFRPEHFELTDYDPLPAMNDIPVTE